MQNIDNEQVNVETTSISGIIKESTAFNLRVSYLVAKSQTLNSCFLINKFLKLVLF
jgi:hypothetical protein